MSLKVPGRSLGRDLRAPASLDKQRDCVFEEFCILIYWTFTILDPIWQPITNIYEAIYFKLDHSAY